MADPRLEVLASIGTRLAIGGYPLAFILAFGWAFGKEAFDTAAAASNWASYLNVLLLSGFALVPPAVARLRSSKPNAADGGVVRDHAALERVLLVVGAVSAAALWLLIDGAFPALAQQAGGRLGVWFVLFAILALSQLPLMLWLGVEQAAGHYLPAFVRVAVPRVAALIALLLGAAMGADATTMLIVAAAIVLVGQWMLARAARASISRIDTRVLSQDGRAARVLAQNLSAGVVGLVGTFVSIAPVTIVGRLLPDGVGQAHVFVTLSNAVGAMIVAAFFPLSLTLAERAGEEGGLVRYCWRVARKVIAIVIGVIVVGWVAYSACAVLTDRCSAEVFAVGSLVVLGAGLRLGSLGVYHVNIYTGHPHRSLPSVSGEAIAVVVLTWGLVHSLSLYALGVAFLVGGSLRLLIALTYEIRPLINRAH